MEIITGLAPTPFSILMEFIEVSLNLFLYTREVYSAFFFLPVTSFGIPVWKCKHPILSEYIQTLLSSISRLVKLNAILSFSIVRCTHNDKTPLEKLSILVRSIGNIYQQLAEGQQMAFKLRLQMFLQELIHIAPGEDKKATSFYVVVKLQNADNLNIESLLAPNSPWYAEPEPGLSTVIQKAVALPFDPAGPLISFDFLFERRVEDCLENPEIPQKCQ